LGPSETRGAEFTQKELTEFIVADGRERRDIGTEVSEGRARVGHRSAERDRQWAHLEQSAGLDRGRVSDERRDVETQVSDDRDRTHEDSFPAATRALRALGG
jgi:hypothetical protein